jgi:hypothetical protein
MSASSVTVKPESITNAVGISLLQAATEAARSELLNAVDPAEFRLEWAWANQRLPIPTFTAPQFTFTTNDGGLAHLPEALGASPVYCAFEVSRGALSLQITPSRR